MAWDSERRWWRGGWGNPLPLSQDATPSVQKSDFNAAAAPDIFRAEMRLIWVWLCMQTMCGPLESSGGDSQISWLIALIPGLSLVILRQIIQDYDLMGCVKSAGKHKQEWGEGGPFERISAANCSSNSRCASWRGWPGADSVSKGGCLTPRASNVPHV